MAQSRKKREERRLVSGRKRAESHKGGFDSTTLNLPDGVRLFQVQKATVYRIEIIPYTVPKGSNNPYADPGVVHFERTYWCHRGIGADQRTFLCPRKTSALPCPICEHRVRLSKDPEGDEDLIRDLNPKERQLWNIFDHDDPEQGVQVWDVSYHLFGKSLDARVKNADEEDGYEYYADPEKGFTLRVGFSERSFAGTTFYETESIDFKSRSSELNPALLKNANVLDNLLIVPDYDKLKSIFLETIGNGEEEDFPASSYQPKNDEEPQPKEVEKSESTADDFGIEKGDEVLHKTHGVCTVLSVSGDRTSLKLVDEKDEIHRGVGPDEVEVEKPTSSVATEEKEAPWDDDWED